MTEYTLDEREERAMPKVSTKKAAKKAARQVTKKRGAVRGANGRFAGRTAPKLSQQPEELLDTTGPFAEKNIPVEEAKPESSGLKFTVSVDAKQLEDLTSHCDRIADIADRVESAAKVIADNRDPHEKQLHRRVVWAVYDADGVRIQNNISDLALGDVFELTVRHASISGSISNIEAR
jgi:hypothetical protein